MATSPARGPAPSRGRRPGCRRGAETPGCSQLRVARRDGFSGCARWGLWSARCTCSRCSVRPRARRTRRTARVAAQRTVAPMLAAHRLFRAPRPRAAVIAQIAMRRPITVARGAVGERAYDRLQRHQMAEGDAARPAKRLSGWIRERTTRLTVTPWHLLVDLRTRTVVVYLDGRRLHCSGPSSASPRRRRRPAPSSSRRR